jgi:alkylation response protein AidB-like acyl-CoA dehydrogenase
VVDKGAEGLAPGRPEDKHGIRSSNTAAVAFDGVMSRPGLTTSTPAPATG